MIESGSGSLEYAQYMEKVLEGENIKTIFYANNSPNDDLKSEFKKDS